MTGILATNITSPIGLTTAANFEAVRRGEVSQKNLAGFRGLPVNICAGCFTEEQRAALRIPGFSWLESLEIRSVQEALSHCDVDPASPRTLFVLSTTLGNVDELSASPETDGDFRNYGESARKVARHLGIVTEPVIVCNACVSGVTAQLLADRLIASGRYDHAIICGADSLSPFIVAVFTSFQSLSPTVCRPFDIERLGLNLGEAASTVILGKSSGAGTWRILDGSLDNDSYHVSAPDPTGDGVRRVIEKVVAGRDVSDLATVCVHGTGTMFNDEMESKAIAAAGLSGVPVSSYKAYFGHTMGACGLLETVLALYALDQGVILPAGGYEEIGVSGRIDISPAERPTGKRTLLKIVSGFGGCNGAAVYGKEIPGQARNDGEGQPRYDRDWQVVRRLRIRSGKGEMDGKDLVVELDGQEVAVEGEGQEMLTALYKARLGDNPRYFKMDPFSRLTYLGVGLLLKDIKVEPTKVGILLFNGTGSILADRKHLATFTGDAGFYPSPAVCINTLPNVVVGEIASRYRVKGETTFLILPEKNEALMADITAATLAAQGPFTMVTGWVDCPEPDAYEADLQIITTQ